MEIYGRAKCTRAHPHHGPRGRRQLCSRGVGCAMAPALIPVAELPGTLLLWRQPRLRPGGHEELEEHDLLALREAGVQAVLCLQEDQELRRLGEGLSQRATATEAAGMAFRSLPTPDFGEPEPEALREALRWLEHALRAGQTVLVHCRAGLGRSGTVAAALIIMRGSDPEEAMAIVRAHRPGAIESSSQEGLLRRLGRPGVT